MTNPHHQTALALLAQGRDAEAVALLHAAARAGCLPAMAQLGAQLLTGRGAPADPAGGVRLIVAAAGRGDGFACALAATLHAAGLSGRPDWPRALDGLQRAAELGFAPAQAQLRLLAGGTGDDWRGLRRAVDIKAWRAAPKPRVLSREPRVRAFEGLASPAVCDWIIARARGRLGPAQVYDKATGGKTTGAERRNSAAPLSLADQDLVLLAMRERLAAAAGLPVMQLDAPQVLHYAVGERFTPHFDFFEPAIAGHARNIAANGQRVATALVYLNDDLEGGETDFPVLGLRHRGGRGDGLTFFNVDSAGAPDRRTLHAGLAPTAGEKWLLSQWIRDRAPSALGDPRLAAALNAV